MRGYRTLVLAVLYLSWLALMAWIIRPPGGYTADLVSALSALAGTVGIAVVGLAGARVAKSYALAKHSAPEDPA